MKNDLGRLPNPDRRTSTFARAYRFAAGLAVGLLTSLLAHAQVNVTTARNDISRTGQNLSETILTPSNVNATQFGKLFTQAVDGQTYAQPLYLSGLTINGAVHSVVFVATQHDSVYAFDADNTSGTNSSPLWKASMLTAAHGAAAGATSEQGNGDINPEIGITGTPVIDPASGTLYVVSKTVEGGTEVQRLHALDVTTGAEKFGGPVNLNASVPGTGGGSSGGTLSFMPLPARENQRPGLLLLNGVVYIGFASHVDTSPWHGWVLAYDATTLRQTGVFCTTPNDNGGGIWMSGTGLAADQVDPVGHPYGRMFAPTGNGGFDASAPYNGNMDYSDSILNLDLSNGAPRIADDFTPSQQAYFGSQDIDVAAGGLLILPTQTAGSHPHLLVQAGKSGTLYLLDRDNLGGYHSTDQVVQSSTQAVPALWSSPAYWNGNVYFAGQGDHLKSFPLVNGLISITPTMSPETYEWPGATPSISASGNTQGIVWTIDAGAYSIAGQAILRAHDASNVATSLYSSATNAARDSAGLAVKFTVPTIANGKVYVGTGNQLAVYGLLSGATQTAVPSFSPGSGSFVGSQSVSISDATSNSTIYYTTDGSPATTSSNLYSGPITVTSTVTINAIATSPGLLASSQASATYTLTSAAKAATPTFTPTAGTYTSTQSVTLSDTTTGATIYYTTDGSTPTTASLVYSGPITVSMTQTIKAIATASGYTASAVASATYTIGLAPAATPTFSPAAGTYSSTQSVTLSDATPGATIYYTTDGSTPTTASAVYSGPISVSTTQTIKAMATASGYTASAVGSASYTIGSGTTPPLDYSSGFTASGLSLNGGATVSGAALVVTDGGIVESRSAWYSTPVNVQKFTTDFTFQLTAATADGFTFAIQNVGPTALGAAGGGLGYQGIGSSVAVKFDLFNGSGEGSNSTGFYTNGASPSVPALDMTASGVNLHSGNTMSAHLVYDGTTLTLTITDQVTTASFTTSTAINIPTTVGGNTAYVGFTGGTGGSTATQNILSWTYSNSVSSGTTPAAIPTFTPTAGSYTSTQSVTLSDTTAGATIYYTTDGSTPTTGSTVYTGPISVSATQTIKAMATASGFAASAVATATYTITQPAAATPTFTPTAGSYTSTQSVTLSDTTAGATIYYTTDGSTPTTGSTVYTGPISVSATQTIKAMATASGFAASAVATATYTITQPAAATPTFTPAAGSYTSTQSVTLSDTTAGATIYYTTDGSTPTTASAVYSSPITVSASQTLKAIATASGYTTSAVGTASYTIGSSTSPAVNYPSGFTASGLSFNGGATVSGAALVLTDGGIVESRSAWYSTPVNVQQFITDFTFQLTAATANGFTFAIQNVGPTALGAAGNGLGYQGIGSSVAVKFDLFNSAGEGTNSTGFYTNGASPTVPALDLTASGVNLHSGDTMSAHLVYDGTTLTWTITDQVTTASFTTSTAINIPTTVGGNTAYVGFTGGTGGYSATQNILSWTYSNSASSSVTTPAATPTFTPAAGSYTSTQSVTLSDTTTGATIYYTTDGSTPTTASAVYSGPISVSATQTIKAMATASGFAASAVASATYTITQPAVATPTFTPVAGSYTSTQSVTLSDTTAGATIYYTTDGSTPTTASTVYTGPISVSATQTIKALATASGYTASAVASATYTITLPKAATPTFTPAAGSYTSTQSVTLSDTTAGATIYYATDGSTPTTASAVYSSPITVSASQTLKAIATASGYTTSAVGTASYTIGSSTSPAVNYPSGFTASGLSFKGGATVSGAALVVTDGGVVESRSAWYSTPVNVQKFTTDFTFQLTAATADGFTFAIQNVGPTALGAAGSGLGYQGIGSSVAVKFDLFNSAGEGSNSTGFYTNGASPTLPALDLTASGVNLHSGDTMSAHLVYDGTTLTLTITDQVTTASFTTSTAINIPTTVGGNTAYVGFTGGTGGLTATQKILTLDVRGELKAKAGDTDLQWYGVQSAGEPAPVAVERTVSVDGRN